MSRGPSASGRRGVAVPRALVLRHHLEDSPGLVGEAFARRGYELDVVMMDADSPTPSPRGYDVLVILGSKHAVYDPDVRSGWFERELDVMAQADQAGIPMLGICFGAQALCTYFGGSVRRSPDPEVGWYEIEAVNGSGIAEGPWFQFHFDSCSLPPRAELWARSPRAVQVFALGRHVGVQFHPELDDQQLAEWLADSDVEVREFGLDPRELMERTVRETPAARERADTLVERCLQHWVRSPTSPGVPS